MQSRASSQCIDKKTVQNKYALNCETRSSARLHPEIDKRSLTMDSQLTVEQAQDIVDVIFGQKFDVSANIENEEFKEACEQACSQLGCSKEQYDVLLLLFDRAKINSEVTKLSLVEALLNSQKQPEEPNSPQIIA
jgi:hypothetical protein